MKKFSSYSKTKKIGCSCTLCCVFMIVSVFIAVFVFSSLVQTDIVSNIEVINQTGATGRVFVAYRPGLSNFQKDITYAFIDGLEENDWRIEVTTISSQTPRDVSSYDLLVFGSPTYGGKPQDSVVEYLSNIGDLNQTSVILIATSAASKEALPIMENLVINANGNIVEALVFHTTDGTAIESSYQEGLSFN